MTSLVFGVLDGIHPNQDNGVKTVADVASELEGGYHLMETFFAMHKDSIIDAVLADAKRSAENGEEFTGKRMAQNVESEFRDYLDAEEHGIKTKAAMMGISHRHKSGFMPDGESRQSFIDTETYRGSFRAWID